MILIFSYFILSAFGNAEENHYCSQIKNPVEQADCYQKFEKNFKDKAAGKPVPQILKKTVPCSNSLEKWVIESALPFTRNGKCEVNYLVKLKVVCENDARFIWPVKNKSVKWIVKGKNIQAKGESTSDHEGFVQIPLLDEDSEIEISKGTPKSFKGSLLPIHVSLDDEVCLPKKVNK